MLRLGLVYNFLFGLEVKLKKGEEFSYFYSSFLTKILLVFFHENPLNISLIRSESCKF